MPLFEMPLNEDQEEIRLFTILPDNDRTRPIRGNLHIVSLYDSPDFEALSYTWGSCSEERTIFVNGQCFPVTPNLEEALLHLRQSHRARVVWIDAICIDQKNHSEKTFQIPLMGDIYSTASQVIAWLGESNPNIVLAMGLMEHFEDKESPASQILSKLIKLSGVSVEFTRAGELAMARAFLGIADILRRPYWNRMWTFQEWHLPGEKIICMCGDFTFDPAPLTEFLPMTISNTIKKIKSRHEDEDTYNDQDLEAAKHIRAFDKIIQRFQDLWKEGAVNVFSARRTRGMFKDYSGITALLKYTQGRKCHEPLDRVYGVYGMCPLIREIYPPTYVKSRDQVMLKNHSLHDQPRQGEHTVHRLQVLQHRRITFMGTGYYGCYALTSTG
ncbi:hypothetical protein LT330_009856 [Penicillium expansum]|nr:hypothetical protein LT330_009856 [Penicillium expansum]